MTLQEFETGLVAFAEKYMVPNLDEGMDRWLFYFGLGEKGIRLDRFIQSQVPMMSTLGILKEDGSINLDDLEKSGKAAFQKQTRIKIWKFTFTEPDFDVLMAHLRGGRQVDVATL